MIGFQRESVGAKINGRGRNVSARILWATVGQTGRVLEFPGHKIVFSARGKRVFGVVEVGHVFDAQNLILVQFRETLGRVEVVLPLELPLACLSLLFVSYF